MTISYYQPKMEYFEEDTVNSLERSLMYRKISRYIKLFILLLSIIIIIQIIQSIGAIWYFNTNLKEVGTIGPFVKKKMNNLTIRFDNRLHRMDRIMDWIEKIAHLPKENKTM